MRRLIYATYASSCDNCEEDKFVLIMKLGENQIKLCSDCLEVLIKDARQSDRHF